MINSEDLQKRLSELKHEHREKAANEEREYVAAREAALADLIEEISFAILCSTD